MYICVLVCAHGCGAHGDHKKALDTLKRSQAIERQLTWVLGTELASARALHVLIF